MATATKNMTMDITMRSMDTVMNMETAAGADMTMDITMRSTDTVMNMETAAGADMTMDIVMRSTDTVMTTETVVGAVTIIVMKIMSITLMPTVTMYRDIPRTVTANCAILMRSTATCAARAWINVPAGCPTSIW